MDYGISVPVTFLFWHSMSFLRNDQSFFMCIKWGYSEILSFSSFMAIGIVYPGYFGPQ